MKSYWPALGLALVLGGLSAAVAQAQSPPTRPAPTGLVLWLDASDRDSLPMDTQGRVAQWRDRSGEHHDVTAGADKASQPQVVPNALHGLPVVRFSGHEVLQRPTAIHAAPGAVTVFVVSRRTADQATAETGQRLFVSRPDATTFDTDNPNFALLADTDGRAGAYPATITDTEQTNVPLGPLALGESAAAGGHSLNADIAEVLVYDRAFLSEGERQVVLDYLRVKWGAVVPARSGDWTRAGGLGPTPKHVHPDRPLSDQANHGRWVLDAPFSDDFAGPSLDRKRWHLNPTSPGDWAGRQPALFLPANVSQQGGLLDLTFRKGDVPEMSHYPGQGYAGYTSALVQTNARTGYGYYEVRARPMPSAGSSAFWFTDTGLSDNQTEIDVFEIGGKTQYFDRKYNMNAHVWATPQEKRHWAVGGVWISPWDLAADYHVYGFEWDKDFLTWYVDGVPVRKARNTNWFFPMRLVFDSEAMWSWFGPVNDADLPSTFSIQYLRVWRHRPPK